MAPTGAAIAMRAVLRDAINRLRYIRENCGVAEDGEQEASTGDPFRDKVLAFTRTAKGLREMICDRNESQRKHVGTATDMARDSHDINVMFRDLNNDLRELENMVKQADKDLARANKKKKSEDKIANYEKVYTTRRQTWENCQKVLEELKTVNQQRQLTEKEVKKLATLNPDQRKRVEQKAQLREQLSQRLKRKPKAADDGGEDAMSPKEGGEDGDGGGGGPSGRIDTDPETEKQWKEIKQKEAKQAQQLDRIHAGILRITDLAKGIGAELDEQDVMLQATESKVDKATKDLKMMNKGLTKLMKDQKPMNMCINISCLFLFLGLVGFFLLKFGAI